MKMRQLDRLEVPTRRTDHYSMTMAMQVMALHLRKTKLRLG